MRLVGLDVLNVYKFRQPDDRPHRLATDDDLTALWEGHSRRYPRTGAEVILTNELHADHARTLVTAAG